jgi:RimJ/RimL family protein N-acetyltransferase
MLRYVYGENEIIAHIAARMIPHMHGRGFGRCQTIGVVDKAGKLIAGIIFHNYHPEAGVIEMTVGAVPGSRWMTRETLRVIREFVFERCGCQMLMLVVPADNEALLHQPARLGFMLVRVPRLLGRDRDAVLCLLTAEAWQATKFNKRAASIAPLEEAA